MGADISIISVLSTWGAVFVGIIVSKFVDWLIVRYGLSKYFSPPPDPLPDPLPVPPG